MLNLDSPTLTSVLDQARSAAAAHPRWLAAIDRAEHELSCNPWIERAEHGGLLIGSPSGSVYAANGTCQCRAASCKIPCWHRAAARLVRLHDEARIVQLAARVSRARAMQDQARAQSAINELF